MDSSKAKGSVKEKTKNDSGLFGAWSESRFANNDYIMKPVGYARNRLRLFVSNTTIHGVKEIALAPSYSLKTLWLLLLLSFTGAMAYQLYHLTNHYFQEPVVVEIKTMIDDKEGSHYELPLTLLLTPTLDLFNASPEANQALINSPFDIHTRYYIRSLVDSNFQVPNEYNGAHGRKQFNRYLADNPHLTWHDVVSPFVANVSYWLGDGDNFKSFSIVNRTVSSYMIYHFIKPIFDQSAASEGDETKDIMLDAAIDFSQDVMKKSTSDHGSMPIFCITSYGLASDMVRIKSGTTHKISFDIVGHRRISLRRRPCVVDRVQYQSHDYEACAEQCRFDAEHKWTPRVCYRHTYDWGFYKIFLLARPCSHGVHYNASTLDEGGILDQVEEPDYIKEPTEEDLARVEETYESCLNEHCVHACQQMSVKFHARSSDFHERLGNKSVIYMTWPGPGAVAVYAETLQYTWDGYVGQLGGLMGLWLGASMISICDLVYICCFCCFRVEKKKDNFRKRKRKPPAACVEKGESGVGIYRAAAAVDLVDNVNENLMLKPVTLC